MLNKIPEITNPMGKYWQQPDSKNIIISYKYALMSETDFNNLYEYSSSTPSGVYIGKMWKSKRNNIWYLVWFSECEDPKFLNNNYREILIR
jgi:hypothetical protein